MKTHRVHDDCDVASCDAFWVAILELETDMGDLVEQVHVCNRHHLTARLMFDVLVNELELKNAAVRVWVPVG